MELFVVVARNIHYIAQGGLKLVAVSMVVKLVGKNHYNYLLLELKKGAHKNNCAGLMSAELSKGVGNNPCTDLLLEELQAADNNHNSGSVG